MSEFFNDLLDAFEEIAEIENNQELAKAVKAAKADKLKENRRTSVRRDSRRICKEDV